ncbi:hypothetical protein EMCRGX_G019607 [Ephydatia muelleri]
MAAIEEQSDASVNQVKKRKASVITDFFCKRSALTHIAAADGLHHRCGSGYETTKATKQLIFVLSFDLNNKPNDPIVGSLVRASSAE